MVVVHHFFGCGFGVDFRLPRPARSVKGVLSGSLTEHAGRGD
jgi:hypothetical protein